MKRIFLLIFLAMITLFGCRAGVGCNGGPNGGGCGCRC